MGGFRVGGCAAAGPADPTALRRESNLVKAGQGWSRLVKAANAERPLSVSLSPRRSEGKPTQAKLDGFEGSGWATGAVVTGNVTGRIARKP